MVRGAHSIHGIQQQQAVLPRCKVQGTQVRQQQAMTSMIAGAGQWLAAVPSVLRCYITVTTQHPRTLSPRSARPWHVGYSQTGDGTRDTVDTATW